MRGRSYPDRDNTHTEWMAFGACRNEPRGTMFPHDAAGVVVALAVCDRCPDGVRAKCLEFALVNREQFGVWGGASERERRRLLRLRRQGAA